MTIEQLAKNGKVSTKQVKKRWRDIGGVTKIGGALNIPEGTRYPMRKMRNIDTHEEKLYALLKAIDTYRYIDEVMLRIPKTSFDILIHELIDAGWIQDNGSGNEFGANRYDSTRLGSKVAREKKKAALKEIVAIISGAAGHLAGGVISELVG